MRAILASTALLLTAACGSPNDDADSEAATSADRTANATTQNLADTMASDDEGTKKDPSLDIEDSEQRPMMQLQVVLDRRGFGPGVIDGKMGMSTENALRGFQEANELEITGEHDEATKKALEQWSDIPATRVVRIPPEWGEQEFSQIPDSPAEKAKLERLGYKSLDEQLAERFHTTVEVLKALNPGGEPARKAGSDPAENASPSPSPSPKATDEADDSIEGKTESFFAAGQLIRVPNIGADRIAPGAVDQEDWQRTLTMLGVGTEQPEVDRIVVSKAGKTLKAYQGEKLVALFTVSSGSSEFPLPLGEWEILGEAYNPPYRYDPEVLGNEAEDGEVYQLPPGPNGPVGVVWIDLSKEHYGIHGTPEPETIGRAQSSGCVRLTNWDAARLAGMVSTKTQVIFEA